MINTLKGFFWGAFFLFTIANLSIGYLNIKVMKDNRHFSIINTDSNCNFIDASSEYMEVVGNIPSKQRSK